MLAGRGELDEIEMGCANGRDERAVKRTAQIHSHDADRIKRVAEIYRRQSAEDLTTVNDAIAGLMKVVSSDDATLGLSEMLDAVAEQKSFADLHYSNQKGAAARLQEVCHPPALVPEWIQELSKRLFRPK